MKAVTAVLFGAGDRGMNAYAPYALRNPHKLRFVAVAEPDGKRRDMFGELHSLPSRMRFTDWKEIIDRPLMADSVLICTQDRVHFQPAIAAQGKGYHVLLEKPMSQNPVECIELGEYSKGRQSGMLICYVLRYTSFFTTIKALLQEGRIGRLLSIQHNENVPMVDQVHAFVRGSWRNSDTSCPMILAHCCHDMDLIRWFAGAACRKVSSFGSLSHFREEQAPQDAPRRCLDGCPCEKECPHYAPKIYLTEDTGWPTSVISADMSIEARVDALKTGPYGRCVYRCDNNVVDHQVACFEFDNGVTAVFTMCAFTSDSGRTLKLMGTRGEIRGAMERNEIELHDFSAGRKELISPCKSRFRYGGGDSGIMEYFVDMVRKGWLEEGLTSAAGSVESHLMAFAAEKSRLEGGTVFMDEYAQALRHGPQ